MNSAFKKILPFVGAGVLIAFFFVSIVFFAYVLFWGLLIGCVLFVISWLKRRFFPQNQQQGQQKTDKIQGKTYEHDDFKS